MGTKIEQARVGASGARLLSVTEAAERVGLKHLAIRRAIHRGELPASKLCGRIRLDPDEVNGWIRRNRITAGDADDEAKRGP